MKKSKLIIGLISAGLISGAVLAEDPVVFVSFGGAYGGAQQKNMVDPYNAKVGKKEVVMSDYGGGVAEITTQVRSNNTTWDVLDIEYVDLERACSEGLLEQLPLDTLPKGEDGTAADKDFISESLSPCAVGNITWSVIWAHRSDRDFNPQTIADVFDTKKFPGKRALRKRPQVNLEWALLADGVPGADVYKVLATAEGQERAFNKLATIAKDVVWFDSWSQAPQLLNDGGAVIVQSANGRIYGAIQENKAPFTIKWSGNSYDFDGFAIVKGSKNFDRAWEFIKYASGTKPLSTMQEVAYGPTRASSSKYIDKGVLGDLPSAHTKEGVKVDAGFWADFGAELSEKFNAWLLKQ